MVVKYGGDIIMKHGDGVMKHGGDGVMKHGGETCTGACELGYIVPKWS